MFNFFKKAAQIDLDDLVLSQLTQAGSDLSKPHVIDFFLYFPKQNIAEQAMALVRFDSTDKKEVKPAAKVVGENRFLLEIHRKMIPGLKELQEARREFNNLAKSLGGTYDGWGTEIVK